MDNRELSVKNYELRLENREGEIIIFTKNQKPKTKNQFTLPKIFQNQVYDI